MLNRLITTLRKRGARGQVFPVQAAEATQAAELIAEVVAQRDELLEALWAMVTSFHAVEYMEDHMKQAAEMARAAIAKATGKEA